MNIEKIWEIFESFSPNDEIPEEWVQKILAYRRFKKNNILMERLLNEEIVEIPQTIVTTSSLQALRDQAKALQDYQIKLEAEIQDMEAKHEAKKAKILAAYKKFNDDCEKLRTETPLPDLEYEVDLSEAYYQQLRAEWINSLIVQQQPSGGSASITTADTSTVIDGQAQDAEIVEYLDVPAVEQEVTIKTEPSL